MAPVSYRNTLALWLRCRSDTHRPPTSPPPRARGQDPLERDFALSGDVPLGAEMKTGQVVGVWDVEWTSVIGFRLYPSTT